MLLGHSEHAGGSVLLEGDQATPLGGVAYDGGSSLTVGMGEVPLVKGKIGLGLEAVAIPLIVLLNRSDLVEVMPDDGWGKLAAEIEEPSLDEIAVVWLYTVGDKAFADS